MQQLRRFIESNRVQNGLIVVILVNALVLGLETWPAAMAGFGDWLRLLDRAALAIFVVELMIKLIVYRHRFFLSGWNVFDFAVVGIALVPAGEAVSVLRALRVLRVLRLLSVMPRLRQVIQGLLSAIPAMGSVIVLLFLVFYVSAVMATKLFGAGFPDWFGSIGASLYSLFQIMTLESWSMGIVRPVMTEHPYAWIFFVPFILVTSFIVLNLFIAIIVNAMHGAADEKAAEERADLAKEVAELRVAIAELRTDLRKR
ncbi:ion transporter [Oceanibacterium hippocampi]|uniref:Ion transport protein n=1 Tax=Oceanibacterium hippocampi TaxID=745714 RepID=A0A1Y5TY03_9PROT|nr:ion transporter [Oceanibacterium hippocampi]SLN76601.1 Ion transport protein [Oceanibacterium hippocampi]